jgi:hypothetical protein
MRIMANLLQHDLAPAEIMAVYALEDAKWSARPPQTLGATNHARVGAVGNPSTAILATTERF